LEEEKFFPSKDNPLTSESSLEGYELASSRATPLSKVFFLKLKVYSISSLSG